MWTRPQNEKPYKLTTTTRRPPLKMVKRGYQKQQREGRHAGVEQSKNARSWETQSFWVWTAMTPSSTSASSAQCCLMRTAMTSSSRSRRSFDAPTRPWPCLELAKVDTGTCPSRAPHRGIGSPAEASGVYQNFAAASSSPSSRSLTTRAKMPSWQLMMTLSRKRSRSKRWTNRETQNRMNNLQQHSPEFFLD